MASQQVLLSSAIMSMVLFAVVTIPADVRHALSSHQPLSWAVSVVVYAVLMALRRFPIGTVAVAAIGSVLLMVDGMTGGVALCDRRARRVRAWAWVRSRGRVR